MRHTRIFVRAVVTKPIRTPERADDFVRLAVGAAGMKVIQGPNSVRGEIPGNEGISSTAVLDFSSVDLHEWDQHPGFLPNSLVHFSLYTCGELPDEDLFRGLFRLLEPVEYSSRVVDLDDFLVTHRA